MNNYIIFIFPGWGQVFAVPVVSLRSQDHRSQLLTGVVGSESELVTGLEVKVCIYVCREHVCLCPSVYDCMCVYMSACPCVGHVRSLVAVQCP